MQVYKPEVKDTSLFREIAKNIVNPLEVLREAVSNSHDAEAKTITVVTYRNMNGVFVLEIQDDGKGMCLEDIHRFFNLGDSDKSKFGIGEKGLGTKIYLKSDKITIYTQTKDNEAYKVVMEKPWENLCNNLLPAYSVEKLQVKLGKVGTQILIEGYVIDNPEKYFNFYTIKDYILWYTAAGSFKTYFANYTELHKYIHNMQVAPRIFLEDKIFNIKEEIAGTHQFHPPQEKPKEDPCETIYRLSSNYCIHFGPYHRATNINGEYVSFQMYGTVSGTNCRKKIVKLKQGESLKSRFGVYLAKDFIPFTKKNTFIPDLNSSHYHLLINSQVFELTADRNNISNEDDPKVKWVLEAAKKIIEEDIIPLANEGYFKLRKMEEIDYLVKDKKRKTEKRLEDFDKIDELAIRELPITKRPDNESQVALLFAMMISSQRCKELIKHIDRIGHYSHQSPTDMICFNRNNEKILVEIEYKLSNLFKHDHPYETFDYVICWIVDLDINEKRCMRDGKFLCLMQENGEWMLKYGTEKIIPVVELKHIVNDLKSCVKDKLSV
ncbi:ATP-binding protein [Clostridium sp. DJ247]|uniref:ATP-binding protein n=1 Tax=Clostridium sp. DJ247 TaxID=2726188 RepID=UPI001626279A|nr:ATP-binding protein [Clostridium sp. DJ247]MBC2579025.1 DNA mismatch repair enzyme (ATPase) [Clostridium sp. DJ247]